MNILDYLGKPWANGASGPQVVEGWYGQAYPRPLARTREYVEIIRKAMSRERLVHEGEHWTLPLLESALVGRQSAHPATAHPWRA